MNLSRATGIALLIVVAFVAAPRTCHAQDPWGLAAATVTILDWSQAVDQVRHPYNPVTGVRYSEVNVILGKHPTLQAVNTYNASVLILNALLPQMLPKKTRDLWWAVYTGFETAIVVHQARIGLHFNVDF